MLAHFEKKLLEIFPFLSNIHRKVANMKTQTEIIDLCLTCLTRLRILRAFTPYASSRPTCLTHMSYRQALGVLFVNPKIFVG